MTDDSDFNVGLFKAGVAWVMAITTSLWEAWSTVPWDKFAQFAAFVYSVCLIIEFLRKKWLKRARSTANVAE